MWHFLSAAGMFFAFLVSVHSLLNFSRMVLMLDKLLRGERVERASSGVEQLHVDIFA